MYKIAIDIGGTIEDTWDHKRIWFQKKGYDLGCNPIGRKEIIKVTKSNVNFYLKMVEDVYSDESIFKHQLVNGAKEALQVLSKNGSIILVSSRAFSKRDLTFKWIAKNDINNYINDIIFLGDLSDKIEWSAKNQIDILIDDDIRHLAPNERNLKFERIWYNASKTTFQSNNPCFHICNSWNEITSYINIKTNCHDFQINK